MTDGLGAGSPWLLLADDEPLIVATVGAALESAGFQVATAQGAAEALERARTLNLALAILDYAMPGQDGLELAASFSQLRQPFMFLSAYSDEHLVQRAVAAGALAYLVKPVDPLRLIPTVRAAVHRARDLSALLEERERLSEAVHTNREVSVAVGLIMAHRGLTRQAAFDSLRQHARRTRRPIRELAQEVSGGLEAVYSMPESTSSEKPSSS
jgi:AmiR/NasT family two-component response regulator